jgi:hypothetical protein
MTLRRTARQETTQVFLSEMLGRCTEPWSELANGWPLPYNQDFAKLYAECHF